MFPSYHLQVVVGVVFRKQFKNTAIETKEMSCMVIVLSQSLLHHSQARLSSSKSTRPPPLPCPNQFNSISSHTSGVAQGRRGGDTVSEEIIP